jgi:hypothetical protein
MAASTLNWVISLCTVPTPDTAAEGGFMMRSFISLFHRERAGGQKNSDFNRSKYKCHYEDQEINLQSKQVDCASISTDLGDRSDGNISQPVLFGVNPLFRVRNHLDSSNDPCYEKWQSQERKIPNPKIQASKSPPLPASNLAVNSFSLCHKRFM